MAATMPLRVGDELLASAKLAADVSGRSAAQQIGYWAKLGRELERSGTVSVREVAEVLAGSRSYDGLDPKSQAIVRAEWETRIEARRAALNLADRFRAEGRSWVDAGPDDSVLRHPAAGSTAERSTEANSGDSVRGARASRATSKADSKGSAQERTPASARKTVGGTVRGAAGTAKKARPTKAAKPGARAARSR